MTAQKIEPIKIQKLSEFTEQEFIEEPKTNLKDILKLLEQFVTIGGDFAG